MERTILHCDMNGFFASVELLFLPELRGCPMAVCGNPDNRHGIILAKSEEAKAYGVKTAETIWQAKRKCPGLILVPPHHDRYRAYSQKINEIYERFTDQVEPFSIDESWLDVTGSRKLFGSGKEIADQIRATVKAELGLTLSVGVSFNKIFAKMGSEYKKPDATTEITKENYRQILWPQLVNELFFVGKVTAERLNQMGINTIGDLASADQQMLVSLLGKQGQVIHDYANGVDDSPVARYEERQKIKSVGNGMTFKRNLINGEDLRVAVISLSDTVAGRLRKYEMKCQGVKIDVKDPLFKTISRQKQLSAATNLAEEIGAAAMELMAKHWRTADPIRMLTITGIGLLDEKEAEQCQLSLFVQTERDREKTEKRERTMDHIRRKYGDHAITYARVLNNDIGIDEKQEQKE